MKLILSNKNFSVRNAQKIKKKQHTANKENKIRIRGWRVWDTKYIRKIFLSEHILENMSNLLTSVRGREKEIL